MFFRTLFVFLLSSLAHGAGTCHLVPAVPHSDQTPTSALQYGKCTAAVEPALRNSSNWCKFDTLGAWPTWPSSTTEAKKCLKFGRATVYTGPIYGMSPDARTACNTYHVGSNEAATVAVSTKYLKTYQGGWADDKGSCGLCMCIRMHGVDSAYNPSYKPEQVKAHIGLTFKGVVRDRCSECDDDHIDLLQDRPLCFAPYDPRSNASVHMDKWAPWVNAKDGLRGMNDTKTIWGLGNSATAVGTWVADWQFVPCNFTHAKCSDLMRAVGYKTVYAPTMTNGTNSLTLSPARRSFPCPWGNCNIGGVQ